jgi:diguanylate cyclase (GGDEF)-like protein
MNDRITEFYRIDPLTGSNNFLSFVETLDQLFSRKERQPFSILYVDMNGMDQLNKKRGHSYGDSALRWAGIVLQEESQSQTFRMGWDDFAVILADGLHTDHKELLHRIFARLNREGEPLGIPTPPAKIALIHYEADNDCTIQDVMYHLWETIRDVQQNSNSTINTFQAQDLLRSTDKAEEQNPEKLSQKYERLLYVSNRAINEIVSMVQLLDEAQKNSFLDSISGLPNMRAALQKMEKEINKAAQARQTCSFLMIDGDKLKRYNSISYADGDELIKNMANVLSEHLRPQDFVARWRTGDEFMVILPNTSGEGARVVGERFCAAIREASKQWKFPTSISIGIAVYPQHGECIQALMDVAEAANKRAKDEGRDRVILAD